MLRVILLSLPIVALLTACSSSDERVYFEGVFFRTKAKKVEDNRAVFYVVVPGVSRSATGAMQAGEYEGTRYCIKNFGSSRIEWSHGPQTDAMQLVTKKDTLVMQGECKL